ncbi:MAG: hypothetical protein RL291_1074 [Pseudomonadota bacterium]
MLKFTGCVRPAAVAAVSAVALMGCKPEQAVKVQPQPVQVSVVSFAQATQSWSYVGTVRPRFETDMGFRVAGKVAERLVDIGQRVTKGAVLARLDATDYRLAIEAQEAELFAAKSVRDQAVAAQTRFKTLLERGHVAQAALDQRIAAADEARARVDRAERNLALARNQLTYTELKADDDGVVTALPVEAGQVVAAGQPAVRIAKQAALEVQVAVPEHLRDRVSSANATVEIWGSTKRLSAKLRELSPDAERTSRTYQARFALTDATELLQIAQLGRTATVHLQGDAARATAQLPSTAVMNDGSGAHVWVVDASGTRVRRAPVEVVTFGTAFVTVASGVSEGDRIVSLGVHMLDADKPVRVIEQRASLQ